MKRRQQLRDLQCPHCKKREGNNILINPPREWSNATWKTQCVHCFDWFAAHILFSIQVTPTDEQMKKADEERQNAEKKARKEFGVDDVHQKLIPESNGNDQERSDTSEGDGGQVPAPNSTESKSILHVAD